MAGCSFPLNLKAAWTRIKQDEEGNVFVTMPHAIKLIELDLDNWLGTLANLVASGKYHPQPCAICEIPKEKGVIRPGATLALADRVVYSACVDACFPQIHAALKWAQGTVDFSHELVQQPSEGRWIRNQYKSWEDFRRESLDQIKNSVAYVLIADIAAYYENIDLATLIYDLRAIECPPEVVDLISQCLNKWAQVNNRGLPQGHLASDVLAKLYLNSVDHNFKANGYRHCRYVDDIRVFCKTKPEARRAIVVLSQLLRRRGLNLQTAKTDVYVASDAEEKIEGVTPIIQRVASQIVAARKAAEAAYEDNPYYRSSALTAEDLRSLAEAPLEILQEAFRSYFVNLDSTIQFDKTLFRYLLKRLGAHKDWTFCRRCIELLETQSQETHTILDYLTMLDAARTVEVSIVTYLNSDAAIYAFQRFQILDWFGQSITEPSPELLNTVRTLAFDEGQKNFVRAICFDMIGKWGVDADLEQLENIYATVPEALQLAIICALSKMERVRRNGFLSRVEGDGEFHRRAVQFVRVQKAAAAATSHT